MREVCRILSVLTSGGSQFSREFNDRDLKILKTWCASNPIQQLKTEGHQNGIMVCSMAKEGHTWAAILPFVV